MEDDELDVLTTDVNDDVRIFVELESRFGMRDCFDQRYVCVEDVFENVFRVAGRADAENGSPRAGAIDRARSHPIGL